MTEVGEEKSRPGMHDLGTEDQDQDQDQEGLIGFLRPPPDDQPKARVYL
jgi:hypothetical protein